MSDLLTDAIRVLQEMPEEQQERIARSIVDYATQEPERDI